KASRGYAQSGTSKKITSGSVGNAVSRLRDRDGERKRKLSGRPLMKNGGEGGIRTRGPASGTQRFQRCSIGHSDTSPGVQEFQVDDSGAGRKRQASRDFRMPNGTLSRRLFSIRQSACEGNRPVMRGSSDQP